MVKEIAFPKPKHKPQRKNLVKRLNDLIRPHIFERDGNACVFCGGTTRLAMAHVLPKGTYRRLEFEPDNIMTMDYKCHLGNGSWHKDPKKWAKLFDEKYPGRHERLQIAARCAPKVDLKLLILVWQARGGQG